MYIYIILLIFVIFISNMMNKYKNDKKTLYTLAIILILIFTYIAGIRSVQLGYDAEKYVISTFYRLSHLSGFEKFMNATTVETGFSIYSYFLYQIKPDMNFMMFGYNLLVNIFIVLFAIKEKDELPFTIVLPIYYMTLYLFSYNIIRQCISIAMIIYAFALYKNNCNKICVVFLIIVSLFFHDSAILSIPIFLILYILRRTKSEKKKNLLIFLIITIFILICLFYKDIIYLLYSFGFLSIKYINYLSEYSDNIDLNFADTLIKAICLIFSILILRTKKQCSSNRETLQMSLIFSIIALCVNIIAFKVYPIYRCGNYYFYLSLFYTFSNFKYIFVTKDHFIANKIAFFIVFMFFIWKIFIGNAYDIYPYHSDLIPWIM